MYFSGRVAGWLDKPEMKLTYPSSLAGAVVKLGESHLVTVCLQQLKFFETNQQFNFVKNNFTLLKTNE